MHLFEFMDQDWLPGSLRDTLRDILECGNSQPFRTYYECVTSQVIQEAKDRDCSSIWELGAGTAPITRRLLKNEGLRNASTGKENSKNHLSFGVCDRNPDQSLSQELHEIDTLDRLRVVEDSIDFNKLPSVLPWPKDALLVLSATLHHLPKQQRIEALSNLTRSGNVLIVAEPLRKTLTSVLFTFLSFVPAILTPLRYARRPEAFRRFAWCWLFPIAPIMFTWDGIVSCLRQWTRREWEDFATSNSKEIEYKQYLFTQFIAIKNRR